jgi:hypothetical protein
MWYSLSVTGRWSSPDIPIPPLIKLTATIYSLNIVERGFKHHKPKDNKNKRHRDSVMICTILAEPDLRQMRPCAS